MQKQAKIKKVAHEDAKKWNLVQLWKISTGGATAATEFFHLCTLHNYDADVIYINAQPYFYFINPIEYHQHCTVVFIIIIWSLLISIFSLRWSSLSTQYIRQLNPCKVIRDISAQQRQHRTIRSPIMHIVKISPRKVTAPHLVWLNV